MLLEMTTGEGTMIVLPGYWINVYLAIKNIDIHFLYFNLLEIKRMTRFYDCSIIIPQH